MSTVLLKLYWTAAPDKQETSNSVVKQMTRTWTESTRTEEGSLEMFKGKFQYLSTHVLFSNYDLLL